LALSLQGFWSFLECFLSGVRSALKDNGGWIIVGLVSVGLGLGILFLASRSKEKPSEQQAAKVHIDLPANINLDTLKCQSCGGNLTLENIQLVAGSPVVHCPYCHTTYQLTEEPKW